MSDFRILLADNNASFLELCAEFVEDLGYTVITAVSPQEAEALMYDERLHLAIMDLRLRDDTDQNDRSGLMLAKTVARALPKIILTRFPVHGDVRDALKPDSYELPPAVDFVDKRGGFEALATAIDEVLAQYAQINWELTIGLEENLTLFHLTQMVMEDEALDQLPQRIGEMEDLLRTLFFDCEEITIGEPLYRDNGRVVVPIYTYNKDGFASQYIVSLGQPEAVRREQERFETAVPQHIRTQKIGFSHSKSTTHFMAAAYTFIGGNLEKSRLLDSLYERRDTAVLRQVTTGLYEDNLLVWYQRARQKEDQLAYTDFLKEVVTRDETPERLQQKIAAICHQANELGVVNLTFEGQQLTVVDEKKKERIFNNPLLLYATTPLSEDTMIDWGHIHGCVCRHTVLVDEALDTWLINFYSATSGPIVHDFVAFESMILYFLLESDSLSDRLLFEEQLINEYGFEAKDVAASCEKTAVMIEVIRHMAQQHSGSSWEAYQLGLYYSALRFVLRFEEEQRYRSHFLTRFVHALCTAAQLATQLSANNFERLPQEAITGLWVDKTNKTVIVRGDTIELTIQEFLIINYLFDRVGQLCERRAIVEEALGETFDPFDPEQSRLNSAMSRLRRKIEPNPDKPRYLITKRGRGYELRL